MQHQAETPIYQPRWHNDWRNPRAFRLMHEYWVVLDLVISAERVPSQFHPQLDDFYGEGNWPKTMQLEALVAYQLCGNVHESWIGDWAIGEFGNLGDFDPDFQAWIAERAERDFHNHIEEQCFEHGPHGDR